MSRSLKQGGTLRNAGESSTYATILIYNGSAYPARPVTAPNGAVTYIGSVVPTDSLSLDQWNNTTPPVISETPAVPSANLAAATYTIPADAGATYAVGGVLTAAGTYTATRPSDVTITATAKTGYALTGTVSWVFSFAAAYFAPGAVMLSDSFNRANGLIDTMVTDSYLGGTGVAWVGAQTAAIVGNRLTQSGTNALSSTAILTLPATQQNLKIEFDIPSTTTGANWQPLYLQTAGGTTILTVRINATTIAFINNAAFIAGNSSYLPGDRVRITLTNAGVDLKCEIIRASSVMVTNTGILTAPSTIGKLNFTTGTTAIELAYDNLVVSIP